MSSSRDLLIRRVRILLWVFIFGLFISGATAIPLKSELNVVTQIIEANAGLKESGLYHWLARVQDGLVTTYAKYPFMAYGTDWLAFGHFMIAVAFIGPLRDPVRNVWVIEFGMIACILVIPFALIMGQIRGIPFGWRLIDCSFGLFGIIPLWYCCRLLKKL